MSENMSADMDDHREPSRKRDTDLPLPRKNDTGGVNSQLKEKPETRVILFIS
jgi:hypothetical protein